MKSFYTKLYYVIHQTLEIAPPPVSQVKNSKTATL